MADEVTSGSSVTPSSGLSAQVNPIYTPEQIPLGSVQMFTRNGSPRIVPEQDVDRARIEEGYVMVQYDIDRSLSEWKAAWAAAGTAVESAIAEMQQVGYMSPANAAVLNEAVGKARDCYGDLLNSIEALVPTEAVIANLADHVAQHGEPDDELPNLKKEFEKHADLVRAFSPKRIAELRKQAEADQAEQQRQGGA